MAHHFKSHCFQWTAFDAILSIWFVSLSDIIISSSYQKLCNLGIVCWSYFSNNSYVIYANDKLTTYLATHHLIKNLHCSYLFYINGARNTFFEAEKGFKMAEIESWKACKNVHGQCEKSKLLAVHLFFVKIERPVFILHDFATRALKSQVSIRTYNSFFFDQSFCHVWLLKFETKLYAKTTDVQDVSNCIAIGAIGTEE